MGRDVASVGRPAATRDIIRPNWTTERYRERFKPTRCRVGMEVGGIWTALSDLVQPELDMVVVEDGRQHDSLVHDDRVLELAEPRRRQHRDDPPPLMGRVTKASPPLLLVGDPVVPRASLSQRRLRHRRALSNRTPGAGATSLTCCQGYLWDRRQRRSHQQRTE